MNVNVAAVASVSPPSDLVPAGTVAVNIVAIGSRSTASLSASNRRVRVPIHCHRPAIAGSSFTGAVEGVT